MQDLAGKVAVVTGAASGIGLALAHRFAEKGCSVVLADIEAEPLALAEAAVREHGVPTLAVRTNVLSDADVRALADAAYARFGRVHILCNNAGVAGGSGLPIWEAPMADFDWVWGVNFLGVLRGIRAFVPRMIASGEEGHIVNTASAAGLLTGADPYSISKHAVVCLTEGLYKQFRMLNLRLSASVLCPGWVDTQINEAERNRPAEFGPARSPEALTPEAQQRRAMLQGFLRSGFPPAEVARMVVDAIEADQFYIFPMQDYIRESVNQRMQGIIEGRNPAATGPLR
ncbi:SDR family NAD(P)-dependent oxidoreductase [Tepidiforma sp.]|uniref:SDR family NAD(P)-dependent oxidoreductase n=1 Tax=Tepidiforma sp. TaxID=2682230 RepID=UPI002ADDC933|nr:SDR family NAD(P)-dependent oxidoreductase [Tepidiforma sp.]